MVRIKEAEKRTNTNPSEKQIHAGNYKKGSFSTHGLKITIENPKGSIRRGVDENGKEWEVKVPFTYGYFNSTIGKDGDQIDVFIGDDLDSEFLVYIVDQIHPEKGYFDEHKVMFGFKSEDDAKEAYLAAYEKGWTGFGGITTFSINGFKQWLAKKLLVQYPSSKSMPGIRMNEEKKVKKISLIGEVKEKETLLGLKNQAGDESLFDVLTCEIASPGGSVSEGLEIMLWFNELSEKGKEVVTVVTANAYSIASLIMLAANTRLISKHGKIMIHNPMIPEMRNANADALENQAKQLRELEDNMQAIYNLFTGLDTMTVKKLMDKETYLTPDEAVSYGFADLVVDIKPRPYETVVNQNEKNMSKVLNVLNRVISLMNHSDVVNQFYYDVTGGEVEIYQSDQSGYKVEDRTNVENGEVKLADGSVLLIEDYVIKQINKAPEPTTEPEPEPEPEPEHKKKPSAQPQPPPNI